ncbi:CBL-interacting serine/threonine-protein kinase 7 [Coffea arabica]|uniref:non-specific serine/threonine protein kinase n=1 Tax=Coffea arabica TaxID=13443 RepID=A0A6P6WLS3_COFAR|nr:CBL-interacting serine/threonine-protein kinase 7 [Coffea arabica]
MEAKRASPPSTTISTTKLARTTSGSGSGSGTIILNKYQLGRLLGRGSFAKVYHGRCLDDNSTVAVKAIDKTKGFQGPLEQFIIREVSVMRRLNHHPSILKIHEVMATKTKIYLVMELAPGGELFSKLQQRGKFSESTARNYFHQLISALHFCHQNGVAHRDIKPQNMLLDQHGNLKISDFGLSALPEQLKNGMLHTACGTPAYTAPEVLYRKGYDGFKADAWSCGVLLYAFLVGSLPFDDSNLPQMHRAIHRRVFDFPEWVSKPAKSIIYRLLDPNPTTRLGIEELLKHSWFKKAARSFKEQEFGCVFGQRDKDGGYLSRLNAFDIISMSSGLNLSGLFEMGLSRKEMRFTSGSKVGEIEERVLKVGGELGYSVQRGKGGGIGLVKGCGILVVEIWEVAEGLWMVEFKVVEGRVVEFEESEWEELKAGLKDIALSWHDEYDGS